MTLPTSPRSPAPLLALLGSPRATSTHGQMLEAAQACSPLPLEVALPGPLLPPFDPEWEARCDRGEERLPAPVTQLRAQVGAAGALIACCPEYAGGVVGSFKNALDWLVGGDEIYGKAFAVWSASPPSEAVRTSLRRIFSTMGGQPVPAADLILPLRGSGLSTTEMVTLHEAAFRQALRPLQAACTRPPIDLQ